MSWFGSLLGSDSGFKKWQEDNKAADLAAKYGTGEGSTQADMLARQDYALEENTVGVPKLEESPSFDLKSFSKDLATGLKASDWEYGKGLQSQKINNIGLLQQAQAPQQQAVGMAANQGVTPPQSSPAMQAITGGIGANPSLDMMLRALRYGS